MTTVRMMTTLYNESYDEWSSDSEQEAWISEERTAREADIEANRLAVIETDRLLMIDYNRNEARYERQREILDEEREYARYRAQAWSGRYGNSPIPDWFWSIGPPCEHEMRRYDAYKNLNKHLAIMGKPRIREQAGSYIYIGDMRVEGYKWLVKRASAETKAARIAYNASFKYQKYYDTLIGTDSTEYINGCINHELSKLGKIFVNSLTQYDSYKRDSGYYYSLDGKGLPVPDKITWESVMADSDS